MEEKIEEEQQIEQEPMPDVEEQQIFVQNYLRIENI